MQRSLDLNRRSEDAARVVLLTPRWQGRDEACWAVRQVAGAIACSAVVDVVTLQGKAAGEYRDGVFNVHELATLDPMSETRRDLILASLTDPLPRRCAGASGSGDTVSRTHAVGADVDLSTAARNYHELTADLWDPWTAASGLLSKLGPDVILLAGHRQVGALKIIEDCCPSVPLMLVPLGRHLPALERSLFAAVFDRAGCALVFSEEEGRIFGELHGSSWARFVGLPMSANPSVLREPNAHTGDSDYVFVLSEGMLDEDEGEGPGLEDQLLRTHFASMRVAVSASDSFVVYDHGMRLHQLPALERRSDLLRLMAWAQVTVELRPGSLFGRHSLESLLYGTPIVVPGRSAARQHAEIGSGGLWFDGPAELVWSTEAVLDPENHPLLAEQGRKYAEARYGSTERFIERTTSAIMGVAKLLQGEISRGGTLPG